MVKMVSDRFIRVDLYDHLHDENERHLAVLMVDKIEKSPVISAIFRDIGKGVMLVLSEDQARQLIVALNDAIDGRETIQ